MNRNSPLIDRALLNKFLEKAGERLTGNWVLMGGTLLPVLGIEHRITTDIDLIGMSDVERSQSLQLMALAEELGLPVEAINQAGAYFLSKIPHYHEHLILLKKGRNATLYRPDLFLFIRLKIGRLSESDLQDCKALLELAQDSGEQIPAKEIQIQIKEELRKKELSSEKKERLKNLEKILLK